MSLGKLADIDGACRQLAAELGYSAVTTSMSFELQRALALGVRAGDVLHITLHTTGHEGRATGDHHVRHRHATERWVFAILAVAKAPRDVRNLNEWSTRCGCSLSILKNICSTVGLKSRPSLDFARLLRVVIDKTGTTPEWHEELEVLDPRTLRRLLARAGLTVTSSVPSVREFLRSQQLVTAVSLHEALLAGLAQS